jgi:hypothetical protein
MPRRNARRREAGQAAKHAVQIKQMQQMPGTGDPPGLMDQQGGREPKQEIIALAIQVKARAPKLQVPVTR